MKPHAQRKGSWRSRWRIRRRQVWMAYDLARKEAVGYLVTDGLYPAAYVSEYNPAGLRMAWRLVDNFGLIRREDEKPNRLVLDLRRNGLAKGQWMYPSWFWRMATIKVDRSGRPVREGTKPAVKAGIYNVRAGREARLGWTWFVHPPPAIEEAIRPFRKKTRPASAKPATPQLAGKGVQGLRRAAA